MAPKADLVAALTAAGLLPAESGPWSEHQRWLVEAGERLTDLGVDHAAVVRLARLGWSVATSEVDAVVTEVAAGIAPEEALERQALRRRAITRLITAVRHGAVSRSVRRLTELGDRFQSYAAELVHVPSPLFLAQHGLGDRVELGRERAEAGDAEEALLLGRLLIGLGRYAEARRWLERLVEAATDAVALSHLAIARLFVGDDPGARQAASQALEGEPRCSVAHAFAAVVLAHEAGTTSQPLRAAEAVREALDHIATSRDSESEDVLQRQEARLARGRLSLLIPSDFGIHQAGLADLEAVLADAPLLEPVVPPGVTEIFRLHAHWFLGHFREVIVIDPASAIAERAFRKLGDSNQGRRR